MAAHWDNGRPARCRCAGVATSVRGQRTEDRGQRIAFARSFALRPPSSVLCLLSSVLQIKPQRPTLATLGNGNSGTLATLPPRPLTPSRRSASPHAHPPQPTAHTPGRRHQNSLEQLRHRSVKKTLERQQLRTIPVPYGIFPQGRNPVEVLCNRFFHCGGELRKTAL